MKKKNDIAIRSSAAEYLTYIAATGDDSQSFEMRYEDENIWLTQKMLAALYDVEIPTINEHIKKIFCDHELQEEATIRKFRIVQTEGSRQVNREVKHYNLQVIISVCKGFYDINFIGQFMGRLLQKSSSSVQMQKRNIWG